MTPKSKPAAASSMKVAESLGPNDPRWRRGFQSAGGMERTTLPITVNREGRFTLVPAVNVPALESEGSVEDKLNELLAALKDAGLMKR
jgi:hypothetical protein